MQFNKKFEVQYPSKQVFVDHHCFFVENKTYLKKCIAYSIRSAFHGKFLGI